MAKIKEITKANVKDIRAELDKHLRRASKKLGIQIKFGSVSYSDSTFSAKLTGTIEGGKSREAEVYEYNRKVLSLPRLGRKFTSGGKKFTIVGLNNRAKKNPVMLEDADGKTYRASIETVIRDCKK